MYTVQMPVYIPLPVPHNFGTCVELCSPSTQTVWSRQNNKNNVNSILTPSSNHYDSNEWSVISIIKKHLTAAQNKFNNQSATS